MLQAFRRLNRRIDPRRHHAAAVFAQPREAYTRALMAAAARHELRFRAVLDLAPPRLAQLEPLPPAPPVRSIVGGAQPYVMLADGNKLMVDGRTGPWRLVQVAANAVVFETAQGRQLTMER